MFCLTQVPVLKLSNTNQCCLACGNNQTKIPKILFRCSWTPNYLFRIQNTLVTTKGQTCDILNVIKCKGQFFKNHHKIQEFWKQVSKQMELHVTYTIIRKLLPNKFNDFYHLIWEYSHQQAANTQFSVATHTHKSTIYPFIVCTTLAKTQVANTWKNASSLAIILALLLLQF